MVSEAPDGTDAASAVPDGTDAVSAAPDGTGMVSAASDGTDAASAIPDEAPPFHARLEYRMGYTVIGTFTDFTTDITLVQTLVSADGENWDTIPNEWHLYGLGTGDEDRLYGLQNQPCLYPTSEPLKSYLAGDIDRFYLKLRITREDGLSYDTQSAVIERSGPQPVPEGTECGAWFSSGISVTEPDPDSPHRYIGYGRYQLTVPADATAEEITALLPDTLPVQIQFMDTENRLAIGIADCPVTWKPLSLPALPAGESITVPDAAEELLVPAGTLVSTPLGIYQLTKPLSLDTPPTTDEVRLVLNVSSEGRVPAGVLKEERNGLWMAFYQKPTGAVSIRTYVLTEGETAWTELSGLSLSDELNQPSTANSGYALVLRDDQEPYRSYLAAADAGKTPAPFFIGLKIEGGIYDGRHLILPWPDIYETLPDLPDFAGAGGNEGNAGADNKDDSTENGQRPTLPQTPDETANEPLNPDGEEQAANPDPGGETQVSDPDPDSGKQGPEPVSDDGAGEQIPGSETGGDHKDPLPDDSSGERPPGLDSASHDSGPSRQTTRAPAPAAPGNPSISPPEASAADPPSEHQEAPSAAGQRPALPQTAPDSPELSMEPFVVQAAESIREEDPAPALPDAKTAVGNTVKTGSRIPFLLIMAVIAAGCTAETIRRTAGYRLFRQIAVKIRKTLHKPS